MAGGGSRGIHAARPTDHRLRSACTQVAFCGVWSIAQEDQKSKPKPKLKRGREIHAIPVAVRLAGGSDFPDATVGKPDCYRGDRERSEDRCPLLILIFVRNRPDAAERDLGAGRTQAMRSGSSGMDAARALSGHGCPFSAGPRSVAGVREPDEVGPNQEQGLFGYFFGS